MNITFVSRHYELKNSQKSLIEEKIKTIRNQYFNKRIDVQVALHSEKYRYRCELNVRCDGFAELVRCESNDMQQSIQESLDKLEMILRKRHDKRVNRKRVDKREMSVPDIEQIPEDAMVSDTGQGGEQTTAYPDIVEMQMRNRKPMLLSEAGASLQDCDDLFLVFRDAHTDQISVIYKRQDGRLGLIKT
ncbi:HPF/RaiA family ribosome-associated protein [bacterium]|nr:HPF/RaiA family ribosome-associated protein [bacterium]